jgi:hypothetical protein
MLDDQFWTGGTSLDCDFHYKYCPSGNKFYSNDSKWLDTVFILLFKLLLQIQCKSHRLAGQPDFLLGGEYCVTAALKSGKPYAINKGMLSDLGCSVGKKVLCEVKRF